MLIYIGQKLLIELAFNEMMEAIDFRFGVALSSINGHFAMVVHID